MSSIHLPIWPNLHLPSTYPAAQLKYWKGGYVRYYNVEDGKKYSILICFCFKLFIRMQTTTTSIAPESSVSTLTNWLTLNNLAICSATDILTRSIRVIVIHTKANVPIQAWQKCAPTAHGLRFIGANKTVPTPYETILFTFYTLLNYSYDNLCLA